MQLCASLVPPRGSQAVDQRLEQIVEQGALAGTDEHLHGHSRAQRLIAELQPRQFVGADPDADTIERLTALLVLQPIGRDLLDLRSEEHTSELQSLMRISYAVFCLKKKITHTYRKQSEQLMKQHNF